MCYVIQVKLGDPVPDEELERMIKTADEDGNETIELEEVSRRSPPSPLPQPSP